MNTPNEPLAREDQPQVNEQRRRLAKGGLAAPIVVGTLLSRPVLGAAPHNCTISGQLSGNVSTHLQGVCSSLGASPQTWLTTWPWDQDSNFYNPNRPNLAGARNFAATPNSEATKFVQAYRAVDVDGIQPNDSRQATVLEVLLGYVPTYDNSFGYQPVVDPKFQLQVRAGYSDTGFELGKEAIAAYRNATDGTNGHPNFPISGPQVVDMFNAVVVSGGTYSISPSVSWNRVQVLAYFKSLHP